MDRHTIRTTDPDDHIMTITLGLILVLVSVVFIVSINNGLTEGFDNTSHGIKWTRTPNCKSKLNQIILEVLKENNLTKTIKHTDAGICFPCGYNILDNEIDYLPHVYDRRSDNNDNDIMKIRKVFIIDGMDNFVAKNLLWEHLVNHYGTDKARIFAPVSYLLYPHKVREQQIENLKREHDDNDTYILKKNIQRQDGLLITKNISDIVNADKSYVIVQKLLTDSYLVNGRKINLRVYVLVTCHNASTKVYVFDDGFMYYTKKEFTPRDVSSDNHITSGYIDRDVYVKNPLTHQDFRKYLNLPEGSKYHPNNKHRRTLSEYEKKLITNNPSLGDIVFNRINQLIAAIFVALKGKICRAINPRNNKQVPIFKDYSASVFGADIAINKYLQPQIIEINKDPDLDAKDKRDKDIKKKMIRDCFRTMGVIHDNDDMTENGFIKVLEM